MHAYVQQIYKLKGSAAFVEPARARERGGLICIRLTDSISNTEICVCGNERIKKKRTNQPEKYTWFTRIVLLSRVVAVIIWVISLFITHAISANARLENKRNQSRNTKRRGFCMFAGEIVFLLMPFQLCERRMAREVIFCIVTAVRTVAHISARTANNYSQRRKQTRPILTSTIPSNVRF